MAWVAILAASNSTFERCLVVSASESAWNFRTVSSAAQSCCCLADQHSSVPVRTKRQNYRAASRKSLLLGAWSLHQPSFERNHCCYQRALCLRVFVSGFRLAGRLCL